MAKIINGPNGERMIVSEDIDELDYDSNASDLFLATKTLVDQKNVVNPLSVILTFNNKGSKVSVPVQVTDYVSRKNLTSFVIKGLLLTADFIWLIETGLMELVEIAFKVGPQPEVQIKKGSSFLLEKVKVKDMNAVTVMVNLSFVPTI